jgi:beta-glucosidase
VACHAESVSGEERAGKFIGAVTLVVLFAVAACHSQTANMPAFKEEIAKAPLYLDVSAPTDQRVRDLISRMTIEEKTSQLVSVAPAIPRLQVPAYNYWTEGLHGIGMDGVATVFPQAIAYAASWNTELVHGMADIISTEGRARYHEALRHDVRAQNEGLTVWSPNINIFRDPRWGRGQETYGEDPYLTSQIGFAYITGLQGDDPRYLKMLATSKHFAVHSGPEPARHSIDVRVSRHDLEDTYLPAFRYTVTAAHAGSVMCAYNSINGEPACANSFLLEDSLRKSWGFEGYVVSDCGAITDISGGHKYAKTIEQAAAVALRRGTDLDCDFTENEQKGYLDAVKSGALTEAEIDRSLQRIFTARFRLGMFDPPSMVKYASIPYTENDSEAHRIEATKVAMQSMVLLKNDGTLPLKKGVRKIAVIGPLGDSVSALLGNYNGLPSRQTTVVDGIRKEFSGAQVVYVPGTSFLHNTFTVPEAAFTTAQGKPGLTAEYFKTQDMSGDPATVRTDARISFGFLADRLPPWAEAQGFAARWTGEIIAPETGEYAVELKGDGGARLWVNGKQLLDDWKENGGSARPARKFSIHMEKGKAQSLKLEYLRLQSPEKLEFARRLSSMMQLAWKRNGGETVADAVAAAKDADVVVAAVGITAELESEEMSSEGLPPGFRGGDRTSLDLPKPEEDLIEAVRAATGKPLVLVLTNGSALSVNWAAKHANAILEAWYPGEEGGAAIAKTLSGANNPAGRLPVTFYRSVDDLPPFDDYAMANRTYRYYKGPVLYPFGFGLSYSTFRYSGMKLSTKEVGAGEQLGVDISVENASGVPGDEVAELYLDFPGQPGAPGIALRGFQRASLAPGEKRRLHFELSPRDLSWVSPDGSRILAAGSFHVFVGSGQPGGTTPGARETFTVQGTLKLPD